MKKRYTVVFEKSDKWWAVHVEGLPGAFSQGKTLEEARENIRDAISLIVESAESETVTEIVPENVLREEILVTTARQGSTTTRKSPKPPLEKVSGR